MRLHLEDFSPPEELPAYQAANQSEYALLLYPGFILRLRPRKLSNKTLLRIVATGNERIPVLAAADILTTLDEASLAGG